jgi:hypothetical protein
MEAVRVRAEAHEDIFSDEPKLSDYPRAHAVASLETGTLSIAAATLIQAGFASRLASIRAVEDTAATFDSMPGLKAWIAAELVRGLSENPNWPTPETHRIWLDFREPASSQSITQWTATNYISLVTWHGAPPPAGTPLRIGEGTGKSHGVFTADHQEIGTLKWTPNPNLAGVIVATASSSPDEFAFEYIGPDDLLAIQN